MSQEKDKQEKILFDYKDVFADVMNVLVWKEVKVKADELLDGPTESIYKTENGDFSNQNRDIAKYWEKGNTRLAILALENQSDIDKRMVLRVIGYDGAAYRSQYENKQLYPVLTVVLNFSNRRWEEKYKSIHQLFDLPEELKAYIQDYKIQVVDVAFLDKEVRDSFQSDFRVVAEFFYQKRLKKLDTLRDYELEHYESVLDLFAAMTNDSRYKEVRKGLQSKKKKGEKVKMCEVLDAYIQDGVNRGREELILNALKKGHSAEEIAEFNDLDLEYVKQVEGKMMQVV